MLFHVVPHMTVQSLAVVPSKPLASHLPLALRDHEASESAKPALSAASVAMSGPVRRHEGPSTLWLCQNSY